MSSDSSNTHTPQAAPPKKWWHPLKVRDDWGMVISIVVGMLALIAPWFLLEPLFVALLPHIPVSLNIKVAVATGVAMLVGLVIIAAAMAVYNKKASDIGLGHRPTLEHLGKAIVGLLVYLAVSVTLLSVVHVVLGDWFNADQPQKLGYSQLGGIEIVVAFIGLVLIAPITEEIIFRGFMFRGIRRQLPFWVTALVVSGLFGLVHGQWNVGLDVFAMSLMSCYLIEKTKSLWPSVFLHVLKNGLAFYIVYLYTGS
jgi:membrane protease YdiL (CAAX protease family)